MKLQLVPLDIGEELKELGFNWTFIPEQYLAVKWLREKRCLNIFIRWCSVYFKGYCFELWEGSKFVTSNEFVQGLSYEEAELEGIKNAIKYLKNDKT